MSESNYQAEKERQGMALSLSGGGFRAALFHLGSLRRLNEVGLLSRMNTISSVSGGSIANGLLAKVWPALVPGPGGVFGNFPEAYEAPLRAFCSKNLRTGPLLWDRLDPRNWPALLGDDHSATDFLANAYQDHLVGELKMRDLAQVCRPDPKGTPTGPNFVLDASNLQTGVNFIFSGEKVGDYQIGHANVPDLLVAEAIAASSSFPLAFPPLVLKFAPSTFTGGDLAARVPPYPNLDTIQRRVVLSDGGVYDNLGLEPVWKSHKIVFCSDGGKPFAVGPDPGEAFLSRLLRCQDVIGNQALAVRKRWLMTSLDRKDYEGAYWGIGTEITGYPVRRDGYLGMVLERLKLVRTDLDAFSEEEQLVLMNHGWLLTDAALRSYVPTLLSTPDPPGTVPAKELLDGPAAIRALAESDRIVPLGRNGS